MGKIKETFGKKTRDTGIEIGRNIPNLEFESWDRTLIHLKTKSNGLALIFISVYCSHCIDLLPQLKEAKMSCSLDFILFTNGEQEDHREMTNYFGWDFPIISLKIEEMEKVFNVTYLPFILLADQYGKVFNKGIVYNSDDIKFLMKGYESL